jgi:hypothetical protein
VTQQQAREALEAQGIHAPGPKLLEVATDAIAREEEGLPGGTRLHPNINAAELEEDTPELAGRSLEVVLTKVVNHRYGETPDS